MKFLTVFLCALVVFSLFASASRRRHGSKPRPKKAVKAAKIAEVPEKAEAAKIAEIEDEASKRLEKALEAEGPDELFNNLFRGPNLEELKKRLSAESESELHLKFEKMFGEEMKKRIGVETVEEAQQQFGALDHEEKLKLSRDVFRKIIFG